MSVGINGISKLSTNNFDEINIRQDGKWDYIIDVIGDNVSRCSDDFIKELKSMLTSEDKVLAIIERFLENYKIDGITKPMEIKYKDGEWVVVYGNNGNNVLRLQLFNSYFDEVFGKIMTKYLNDRYSFCWNTDINKFRITTDECWSRYGVHLVDCCECSIEDKCDYSKDGQCDEYGQLYLFSKDGMIKDFEIEFIKEFLNYRFDLYNEEVKVINIMTEYDNSLNRRFNKHIIRCGDFSLEFPHREEFMFIFGIVNDYNSELFKINNDVKKRQLKMEGF